MDAAASSLREARDAFRDHGDYLGLILTISGLGELARRLGDVALFAISRAELLISEIPALTGKSGPSGQTNALPSRHGLTYP